MTCVGPPPTFRLLDAIVGWDPGEDPDSIKNLTGLDDPDGIVLVQADPGAIGADALSPYLSPPWIAPGCGPCEWYLAAISTEGAKGSRSRLLHLGRCSDAWRPVWPEHCTALPHADIVAIAVSAHRIAIADRASSTIYLFEAAGNHLAGTIAVADVAAMTFERSGALLVAQRGQTNLLRYDPAGMPLKSFVPALPKGAADVARICAGTKGWIWIAAPAQQTDTYYLWRARSGDPAFTQATLSDLAAAQSPSGLAQATSAGFCIARPTGQGDTQRCCWSRSGCPIEPGTIPFSPRPSYEAQGQLLTLPIDSGMPRCIWHRARLDADIPPGTSVSIAVATAEHIDANPQGANGASWVGFPAGVPHALDWQDVSATSPDFLIQQPPGRYLYVRLRLESSDRTKTPRVRRLRLDFPRATSLDYLPGIYRQDPDAADFTARFLALFDASIADLDAAIERAPALLDANGVPDDVLPWLGRFLGVALDPSWDASRTRAILRALPELYRLRGTLAGLKLAFRLVFDIEPAIEELAVGRRWAAFDRRSNIGSARLFGRRRTRAQIGRSALGATVLKSYGNPAADPLEALAYRLRVLVPPLAGSRPLLQSRLQSLLDSQKPAHTLASLRLGGEGFVLGTRSAIGIDTVFSPPPAPILGRGGNVRLSRATVLRRGRLRGPRSGGGLTVGTQPLTE